MHTHTDQQALADFTAFVVGNFSVPPWAGPPSSASVEQDPAAMLHASVETSDGTRFHLSALRVRTVDGEQTVDAGADPDDLQGDLVRLLEISGGDTFTTATFGSAEYIVFMLPHCA